MPASNYLSPVTVSIRLPAIAHNLSVIRTCIPSHCDILPIVKAEGYGHGAVAVAQTLMELGIRQFGVSTVEEGLELRENGIEGAILVMGGLLPSHLSDLVQQQLTPVLSNLELAKDIAALVHSHHRPYSVHLKIDTGMRRLGFPPDQLISLWNDPVFKGPLRIAGLMTHLADADNSDRAFTDVQIRQFQRTVEQIQQAGYELPLLHASNTAGILSHPSAHFGMVRPGLMLYGYAPTKRLQQTVALQPAMRVTTHIVHVRHVKAGEPVSYHGTYRTRKASRIAILPVGYSHGLNRKLSNVGFVLIGEHQVPILGNICMDMTLVDVTEVPESQWEDEVVLLGRQGSREISAHDLAEWQGTIPYEVLCAIGPRTRRLYQGLDQT